MPEEFEYQDLSEAVFWDVALRRATFRDVDLTGARIRHSRLVDVEVDGDVDRLVVNGVDVTDVVNAGDRWYPLRAEVRAKDPAGLRRAQEALAEAWAPVIERARSLTDAQLRQSVDGEWSFIQTLRHLVFCDDKWFLVPVLGEPAFHAIGISNSGSADFFWPGVDREATATLDDVLAVCAAQSSRLAAYLDTVTDEELARQVEVLENGTTPVADCLYVVSEESFQHLRYATRDLDRLTTQS